MMLEQTLSFFVFIFTTMVYDKASCLIVCRSQCSMNGLVKDQIRQSTCFWFNMFFAKLFHVTSLIFFMSSSTI